MARGSVRDVVEIAIVFALILVAVWTPQGRLNAFFSVSAAACVVAFAVVGRWSARELGLTRPFSGIGDILLVGAVLCGAITLIGIPLRFAGPGYPLPLHRSWDYIVWALAQEFILQGIFFVRLESLLGGHRAVVAPATLFAIAHNSQPSPDGSGVCWRAHFLRIVSPLEKSVCTRDHSRNARTHDRCQPAGPLASSHAGGNRILEVPWVRRSNVRKRASGDH